MKKPVCLLAGFFVSAVIFIMAVEAKCEVGITASLQVFSRYIIGHGFVVHDEPVTQLDVKASFPNGFYLDMWGCTGFDTEKNLGDEIDYTIGWSTRRFHGGVAYYDINEVFSTKKDGDIILPFAEALFSVALRQNHNLEPYLRAERFHVTRKTSYNSGWSAMAGLRYKWKTGTFFTVFQHARFLYNSGVFGSEAGYLARYESGLGLSLPSGFTLTPELRLSIPLNVTDRKTEAVVGIGMSRGF